MQRKATMKISIRLAGIDRIAKLLEAVIKGA